MSPRQAIARIRAELIANHLLVAVPGRPEELEQIGTGKRVSVVYGGLGSIRIRLQEGRVWGKTLDLNVATSTDTEHRVRRSVFVNAHLGPVRRAIGSGHHINLDLSRPVRDIPMA